jgi:transposase-like protein
MVTETILCAHCGSDDLIRFGFSRNGKQRYRCRACTKTSRKDPTPRRTPAQRREQILAAYEERSSLRGLARTFHVSRNTVSAWLKKSRGPAAPDRDAG